MSVKLFQYLFVLIFVISFNSCITNKSSNADSSTANKKPLVYSANSNYEKGVIKNGFKEGVWEYYDKKELKVKINYSTSELLYLAKDTSHYAIKTEKGWELMKLDVHPRYIGSIEEFYRILYKNLKYPIEARKRFIGGTVLLSFEISTEGKATNIEILNDIGGNCGTEVVKAFNMIPNYWLVAKLDGKEFTSRYVLPVIFRIEKRNSSGRIIESKMEKNSPEKHKVKAKYLDEVVVTALGVMKKRTRIF